jgi:hypothetical protein
MNSNDMIVHLSVGVPNRPGRFTNQLQYIEEKVMEARGTTIGLGHFTNMLIPFNLA